MKHARLISLLLAVATALCFCAGVQAEIDSAYPDLEYEIFEANGRRQARIVDYRGYNTFVVLPDTLGGAVVTELGEYLFYGRNYLTGVVFPSQLEVIGDNCFYGCTSLKEALLPGTIRFIGTSAFLSCTSLERIDLPRPIDFIGSMAFELTPWRTAHPDWYNHLYVTEITTAQELAEQLHLIADPVDIGTNLYGYDRYETRILDDIDCTGTKLEGMLVSPILCGWDAQTNRPAMRRISNVEMTPYGYGDFSLTFHGCQACQEQGQSAAYHEDGRQYYFCGLHADCMGECGDCHESTSWSGGSTGILAEEISYLALESWTIHPILPGEAPAEEYEVASNQSFLILANHSHHLSLTDFHYEGRTNEETPVMILSNTAEDIHIDGLHCTLPDGCSFNIVLPLYAGTLNRCMVTNAEIDAPTQNFCGMISMAGATDCLVSGIQAKSAAYAAGICTSGTLSHAVVRDITLEALEEQGTFYGIEVFPPFGGLSLSDETITQAPVYCSHVVVDLCDPLLTSPLVLNVSEGTYNLPVVQLDKFFYTDETGHFDPASDFLSDPAVATLLLDGIYRVTSEELRSDELLAALNQPIAPGTDKTTAWHWARGEDYCDGCPIPYVCSPYASPAPAVSYGDVDQNGRIDASDALWILQSSVSLRELNDDQAEAADVNGDYQVNAADALLALQRSVELIDRLPMEPYDSLLAS